MTRNLNSVNLRAERVSNGFVILEAGPDCGMMCDQYVARFKSELRDVLMQRAEAKIDEIVENLTT